MLREIKKIFKITGNGRRFFFLILLRSPIGIAQTYVAAYFLQRSFDAILQNNSSELMISRIVFGIASLCTFLYNGIVWSIYAPFVVRMESRLRIRLFDKITKFSYEHIETTPQGEWLTRLNTDVQMPFSQPIHFPHAVNAILRLCVSAIFLWRINPAVFGWVMLFVVPHFLTSQFFVVRFMQGLNKKSLEATAKNTGEMAALITCADVALLYDGQEYLMKKFEKSSLNLFRAKMKIWKRNSINAVIAILPFGMSGYLVLLIVSGGWIAQGQLTFGDLTAAFQYRLGVLIGANMLINCIVSIKASMAGIHRINETVHEKTEGTNG